MIRGLLIAGVIATFVGQAVWAAWMDRPQPHRLADVRGEDRLAADPLLAWDRQDEILQAIMTSAVWVPTQTFGQEHLSAMHNRI